MREGELEDLLALCYEQGSSELANLDDAFLINRKMHIPKGNYFVNGALGISDGGSLFIEPGSNLFFAEDAGIYLEGGVLQVGEKGAKEVILSARYKSSWPGVIGIQSDISIYNASISHVVPSALFLDRVFTEEVGDFAFSPILISESDLIFDGVSLYSSQGKVAGALYLDGSSAKIENSSFSSNKQGSASDKFSDAAILGAGAINSMKSDVLVRATKFEFNKGDLAGAICSEKGSLKVLDACEFYRNGNDGTHGFDMYIDSPAEVTNNTFSTFSSYSSYSPQRKAPVYVVSKFLRFSRLAPKIREKNIFESSSYVGDAVFVGGARR